jgi:guanylate kinase
MQPFFFIITGYSCCGKSTYINASINRLSNIFAANSYTTRPKRPNEITNTPIGYEFLTLEQYKLIKSQSSNWSEDFIHGYYYGINISEINNGMSNGNSYILPCYPSIYALEKIESLIQFNTIKILIKVNIGIIKERLLLYRNESDYKRLEVESKINMPEIENYCNQVFQPSNSLTNDCNAFIKLINSYIGR